MKARSGPQGYGIPPVCDTFVDFDGGPWCGACRWRWNLHAEERARRPVEPVRSPMVLRLDEDAPARVARIDAGHLEPALPP